MPKRQCPFDYDLVPQMKIHYGQKEYDLKCETNMSKIHDKTLQMLFKGSKQLYQVNDKSKTKLSTLANSAGIENECNAKNISEFCAICTDLNVAESKCSFCDKWICQSCSAVCLKCSELFCVAHSVKLYRRDDGECVCFNCCVTESYLINN